MDIFWDYTIMIKKIKSDASCSEAVGLWNGNYLRVLCTNFLSSFAFFLVAPLLSLYLSETFHASKDLIGLALSGYTITLLLARPLAGGLADRFPRKPMLLLCLFCFLLCFGGYLLAASLLSFVLVRTLQGIPSGGFTVINNTMVLDVVAPARRNEAIGYYGISSNLSMAIAPMMGVWLYATTQSYASLFWTALAVAGLSIFVAAGIRAKPHIAFERKDPPEGFCSFLWRRGFLFGLHMLVLGCCYGALCNYLAVYSVELLHFSHGTGIFFLLLSLGLICSRLQGANALRAGRFIRHASEGLVLSSIGYGLFVLSSNLFCYFGAALLIGFGNGRLWPAFQNMSLHLAGESAQGTAISLILSAWSLGIGLGTFIAGLLVEFQGYGCMFGVVAVLHLLGGILFFFRTRKLYKLWAMQA
ncbi:MAG: MFS transporter [Desulfovibrio sp.]|nr:MFS transporter [Desulfovibrio sp.]